MKILRLVMRLRWINFEISATSKVFQRHWNHIRGRYSDNDKYKTKRFTVNATKETPTIDELIDMMPFVRSGSINFV